MSNVSDGPTDIAQYVIRRATDTDFDWFNANAQGWPIHEHGVVSIDAARKAADTGEDHDVAAE